MAESKALALFDFDKTLTTKDTFVDFLLWYFSFKHIALTFLRHSPRLLGVLLFKHSNEDLKLAVIRVLFANLSTDTLEDAGERYLLERISSLINPDTISKMKFHQLRNHHILIVSASLDLWLKPWCKVHSVNFVCTRLENSMDIFTGELDGPHCYGSNKVGLVKSRLTLDQFEEIFVYGNLPADKDLLALATSPSHRFAI